MKATEIRKMKTGEIADQINNTRSEITELKRRIHMGETQNVRVLRNKRKDLARMLTVMSENLEKETV